MSAGTLDQVSFAPETTWGTAVTPTKSVSVKPGDGIVADAAIKFPTGIRASLHKNNDGSFKGAAKYEGSYDMDLRPGSMGYFLKSAIGAVSSVAKVAPNAVVYDHTFTEQESKPSLTIEQAMGEVVERYAGAIATGFKLSVKPDDTVLASFPIKAKSRATATKITPAYDTMRAFNFNDLATSGFKIATSIKTQILNLEVECKNNLEMLVALLSGNPSFNYIKPSEMKVKFDLYMDVTSATEYVAYLNKTTQQLDIVMTGDAIGSSSNYGLNLAIPKVTYTVAKASVTDDYNVVQVEGEAEEDPSTGKLFTLILTNLLTGYP